MEKLGAVIVVVVALSYFSPAMAFKTEVALADSLSTSTADFCDPHKTNFWGHVALVSHSTMHEGAACGKKIRVTCNEPPTQDQFKPCIDHVSVDVIIVGVCKKCGGVILPRKAFKHIAKDSVNVIKADYFLI